MKYIKILGNGPSIKNFNYNFRDDNIIIGTNNIILDKKFSQNKNYIYTAYDKSFFKKKNVKWLNALNESKCQVYFTKKDYFYVKSFLKKKIKNFNFLKKYKFINKFIKKFSTYNNKLSTVIIERAIPLSLYIAMTYKIKFINLYGCEFNYYLNKKGKLTYKSYFYGNNNKYFRHTLDSATKWKEYNIKKFVKIKFYLNNLGLFIKDKTPNGSLNFLN